MTLEGTGLGIFWRIYIMEIICNKHNSINNEKRDKRERGVSKKRLKLRDVIYG